MLVIESHDGEIAGHIEFFRPVGKTTPLTASQAKTLAALLTSAGA